MLHHHTPCIYIIYIYRYRVYIYIYVNNTLYKLLNYLLSILFFSHMQTYLDTRCSMNLFIASVVAGRFFGSESGARCIFLVAHPTFNWVYNLLYYLGWTTKWQCCNGFWVFSVIILHFWGKPIPVSLAVMYAFTTW
jgi:hypothetical protein